jgi:anti-sigma B factor antagonist
MHATKEHIVERLQFEDGSTRPHRSETKEAQPAAALHSAGTFSVRVLAAEHRDQQPTVLGVHGDIDLGTAPVLQEALRPVLEHHTAQVVLDLSEVAFMDSTGVHVLVDTLERLRLEHRRLAIVCREGGQVHRVLGLVGLLDALAVYRSREAAVIGTNDHLLRPEPGSNPGRPNRER